jgi:hypothetical protein
MEMNAVGSFTVTIQNVNNASHCMAVATLEETSFGNHDPYALVIDIFLT